MNPLQETLCKPLSNPATFKPLTFEQALRWGTQQLAFLENREAADEAERLLEEAAGCSRPMFYFQANRPVSRKDLTQYQRWIRRRKRRMPLAYILGGTYFWNEYLKVGPGCLIPRPETEILIERFIEASGFSKGDPFQFLDLGCGSGAIGIALLRYFRSARATFLDISEDALEITHKNSVRYGLLARSELLHSDLFEAVRSAPKENLKKWDAVLSNPPYLSKEDWENVEPEILFEPRLALDGGEDGFDFYERILDEAPEFLNPGGWLAFEVGQGQATIVTAKMQKSTFKEVRIFKDYNNIERVLMARVNF